MTSIFFSPFLIPIVAMLIPIVAIIAGAWTGISAKRTAADQRMAMIARGIPLADIESFMKSDPRGDCDTRSRTKDPLRSLGNARRAAIVLISTGLALAAFFIALGFILHENDVFSGAAIGLIPLFIGIGFVVDYHLQKRELARFGLEIDSDPHKN